MNDIINRLDEISLALEKQEPKKPNIDINGQVRIEKCPTCHERVFKYEHHCKCGQALDWYGIMTNFDYIKRMNINEMAKFLLCIEIGSYKSETLGNYLKWLESSYK